MSDLVGNPEYLFPHNEAQLIQVSKVGLVTALVILVQTKNEPRCEKNRSSGFLTWSDTNRAVQSQKMARGLKFCI